MMFPKPIHFFSYLKNAQISCLQSQTVKSCDPVTATLNKEYANYILITWVMLRITPEIDYCLLHSAARGAVYRPRNRKQMNM